MDGDEASGTKFEYPQSTLAMCYNLPLPLTDNKNRLIRPEKIQWAEAQIASYVGGLTKQAAGEGFWVDRTALLYHDFVVPIQVVATPSTQVEQWFIRFAIELSVLTEILTLVSTKY